MGYNCWLMLEKERLEKERKIKERQAERLRIPEVIHQARPIRKVYISKPEEAVIATTIGLTGQKLIALVDPSGDTSEYAHRYNFEEPEDMYKYKEDEDFQEWWDYMLDNYLIPNFGGTRERYTQHLEHEIEMDKIYYEYIMREDEEDEEEWD